MAIPGKVATRLAAGIKRFQPIVLGAKSRDINESDTVIIVTDMLEGVFGFDNYAEVTSEMMIRSTFCDLAIRLDGKIRVIIEVKAIGLELKEPTGQTGRGLCCKSGNRMGGSDEWLDMASVPGHVRPADRSGSRHRHQFLGAQPSIGF
jgi:hypothetical protein